MVIDVIEGYVNFPTDTFAKHLDAFYPIIIALLEKEINSDLRGAIWVFLRRTGECRFGMPEFNPALERGREGSISSERGGGLTPISPGPHARLRRGSRVSNRG